MLRLTVAIAIALSTLSYLPSTSAQSIGIGQTCNIERNRLTATTHQFLSDCVRKAYCDPVDRVCKPKGCRSEEFPFGYKTGEGRGEKDELPPFCGDGQFCPDEEDACLPTIPAGQDCQLNRDDQCQPPPNANDLKSDYNHNGALCLGFTCYWANATLSQDCVVDNTAYTGYRADGTQFATIISRDNCIAPSLWCNSQTNKCEGARNVGEACQADKMCLSRNCGTKNTCELPAGSELEIKLWQYIVTGVGIVAFMLSILVGLFLLHRKHRAKAQREVREYYHEQSTYRNSIIALHTAARDRTSSLFSRSDSRFSQYDEHGAQYRDDDSQRHLLGRTTSNEGYSSSVNVRNSRLRHSVAADDSDSDEEKAQSKNLLAGRDSQDFSQSRQSFDFDTPRQSQDYGGQAGSSSRGGYDAVPMRQSVDLPIGASMPQKSPFKDPWEKN